MGPQCTVIEGRVKRLRFRSPHGRTVSILLIEIGSECVQSQSDLESKTNLTDYEHRLWSWCYSSRLLPEIWMSWCVISLHFTDILDTYHIWLIPKTYVIFYIRQMVICIGVSWDMGRWCWQTSSSKSAVVASELLGKAKRATNDGAIRGQRRCASQAINLRQSFILFVVISGSQSLKTWFQAHHTHLPSYVKMKFQSIRPPCHRAS